MGPDTARAIRRFQATYGLDVDGKVTDELIEMLYRVAEKGRPANGHLYVRQKFNPVLDAPVMIQGGGKPLGSHLFTAQYFEPGATQTRWRAVTLKKGSPVNAYRKSRSGKKKKLIEGIVLSANELTGASAEEALNRIEIPNEIRKRINEMLTPGSSLAFTNDGISRETTPKGTDFIVLMQ
jgi:peptidoglycan hydrolase-like protein with peptidoglycan-binding domain